MEQLIKDLLASLGKLSFASITGRLSQSNLREVLKRSNRRLSAGVVPCEGHEWRNVSESYSVSVTELDGKEPREAVELVQARRAAALLRVVADMESLFADEGGDPAAEWKCYILEGWWLRETVYRRPDQPHLVTVAIDTPLAFVPVQEEVAV